MRVFRRACIVLASVLIIAYGLWARYTSTRRILVTKDTNIFENFKGTQGHVEYDPYFIHVNFTRAIMLPVSNTISAASQPH